MFGRRKETPPKILRPEFSRLLYAVDLTTALGKVPEADIAMRKIIARNFLNQFDLAHAETEVPIAKRMLIRIAEEQGISPEELFASGVLLNLQSVQQVTGYNGDEVFEKIFRRTLERAMRTIEILEVPCHTVEFFIAFCLEWLLDQEDRQLFAAHYAQRAAKFRPDGKLTTDEWDTLRDGLFSLKYKSIESAFLAHAAARGDTQVVFELPKE